MNSSLSRQVVEGTVPSKEETTSATQYGSVFRPRTQPRAVTAPVSARSGDGPVMHQSHSPTSRADQIPTLLTSPAVILASAQNPRSSKVKFNLLNPMSLLARRRSSQLSQLSTDSSDGKDRVIPGMRLPDGYDPRIRGKVVHDFSAPRLRRDFSLPESTTPLIDNDASRTPKSSYIDTARSSSDQNGADTKTGFERSTHETGDEISRSNDREHIPVFTEHFGDDVQPWSNEYTTLSSERIALTLSNMAIPEPDREAPPLPAFARNLPSDVNHRMSFNHERSKTAAFAVVPESSVQLFPRGSSPPTPPLDSDPHTTSVADLCFHPAGLPRHLASTASRFSFDLAGVGSAAQEKQLEERHKQKAFTRTSGPPGKRRNGINSEKYPDGRAEEEEEEDEDAYMYGDINDGDDLEERVPGINADAEDCHNFEDQDNIRGLQFTTTLNPALRRPAMEDVVQADTCPNAQRPSVETVSSKESAVIVGNHSLPGGGRPLKMPANDPSLLSDGHEPTVLDIIRTSRIQEAELSASSCDPSTMGLPTLNSDSDDLYFHDGVIPHPQEVDMYGFDESIFDDEASRFYGQPPQTLEAPLNHGQDQSATSSVPLSSAPRVGGPNNQPSMRLQGSQSMDQTPLSLTGSTPGTLDHNGHAIQQRQLDRPGFSQTANLTRDNLGAYHDALAYATHQATVNGHFFGFQSTEQERSPISQATKAPYNSKSQSRVVLDQVLISQDNDLFPDHNFGENHEGFVYEDAIEDDPIIAAANAEALENDDEGFYGQEFGFYAQSSGSGEAQSVHGGYFGPGGIDGITRSHSGRVNFQEPSLTPITERSEFSNRNSMISLGMYGAAHPVGPHSAGPPPSPGLAQLADMMHLEEEDMSLSALLKLRRGAWGGSNASLHSSAGSQNSGSPVTYAPALGVGVLGSMGVMGASSYSLVSSIGNASDDGSPPPSPTVTLQTQGLGISAPAQAEKSSGSDSSPVRRSAVKGKGHNRNSSGADSVSYIKEKTEEGGARWVLEKRRTADTGQVEILGRELVVGGRI